MVARAGQRARRAPRPRRRARTARCYARPCRSSSPSRRAGWRSCRGRSRRADDAVRPAARVRERVLVWTVEVVDDRRAAPPAATSAAGVADASFESGPSPFAFSRTPCSSRSCRSRAVASTKLVVVIPASAGSSRRRSSFRGRRLYSLIGEPPSKAGAFQERRRWRRRRARSGRWGRRAGCCARGCAPRSRRAARSCRAGRRRRSRRRHRSRPGRRRGATRPRRRWRQASMRRALDAQEQGVAGRELLDDGQEPGDGAAVVEALEPDLVGPARAGSCAACSRVARGARRCRRA